MKQIHRITLTASEVRAAIDEWLSMHDGAPIPDSASIRCLTQVTFGERSDASKMETDLIEISWDSE